MKIQAIDHITINATDLDASIKFYTEGFGLERLNSVDMGDHLLTYFRLSGSTRLELITYDSAPAPVHCEPVQPGVYRHFAIEVDDVRAYRAQLAAHGAKIVMEPERVEKLGAICMLIQDPNGVEIEIVEKFK